MRIIEFFGVKTVITIYVTTFGNYIRAEIVWPSTAHIIRAALPFCVCIDLPEWGVDIIVTKSRSFSDSAKLILAAHEELDADYGEDSEHQD